MIRQTTKINKCISENSINSPPYDTVYHQVTEVGDAPLGALASQIPWVARTKGASRSKLDKEYRLTLAFSEAYPTICYIISSI